MQIGEEIKDEPTNQDEFINDYYDENLPDEPLKNNQDLDYSQSHLDDFLKSQVSRQMLKNTNIQSGALLSSFVTTVNRMTKKEES